MTRAEVRKLIGGIQPSTARKIPINIMGRGATVLRGSDGRLFIMFILDGDCPIACQAVDDEAATDAIFAWVNRRTETAGREVPISDLAHGETEIQESEA